MNYTKEKILLKAKKVLKDLNPAYFNEGNISNVIYNEKDEVARPAGEIINTWVVIINEPVFDSLDFLVFSDITGEPLYIQSKHSIHEIKKTIMEIIIKKRNILFKIYFPTKNKTRHVLSH